MENGSRFIPTNETEVPERDQNGNESSVSNRKRTVRNRERKECVLRM